MIVAVAIAVGLLTAACHQTKAEVQTKPEVAMHEPAITEPAEWAQGLPIPRGARRNHSLGGATTLAPGRNYVFEVYDVDASLEAITAFYERHLPEAGRSAAGDGVMFSKPGGRVTLVRSAPGTRIHLSVGPISTPSTAESPRDAMQGKIGTRVQLEGTASNAKGGAVIEGPDGPVYIEGLDRWPPDVRGKRVRVDGLLVSRKLFPDPETDPARPQHAAAAGMQFVLERASWSLLE